MDQPQQTTAPESKARTYSTLGVVFALLSLIVLPIVFGPVGIVFGVLGTLRGDKKLGITAIVLSVVLATISTIVGAYFYSHK